jgi:hypothetical protein
LTNGNKKGGVFERDVCKTLSMWVSNNESSQWFERSANSGGKGSRIAKAARSNSSTETAVSTGDIVAVHPGGSVLTESLIVEAKNGYDDKITLPQAFWLEDNLFWKFISQSERASIDKFGVGWRWWLIFKQWHKPTFLFTSEQFTQKFITAHDISHVHVDHFTYGRHVMFDFKQFIGHFEPKVLFPAVVSKTAKARGK